MYLFDLLVQVGLALLAGTVWGLISRLLGQRNAGIRVFVIISLGCCLVAYISVQLFALVEQHWMVDPTRISAQLVSAVGFIVAGIIWYQDSEAKGVSSAALLWVTAIIGMMIGVAMYRQALLACVVIGLFLLMVELRSRYFVR